MSRPRHGARTSGAALQARLHLLPHDEFGQVRLVRGLLVHGPTALTWLGLGLGLGLGALTLTLTLTLTRSTAPRLLPDSNILMSLRISLE